jgi:alpha-N-arabinofuranosidase
MFAEHLGDEVLGTQVTGAGPRFFVSSTRDSATGRIYLKLVNGSSVSQPVRLHLNGVTDVKSEARLTTLRGNTPEETNSIGDPGRILPVVSTIHNAGTSFEHTMPPYSIQLFDVETR